MNTRWHADEFTVTLLENAIISTSQLFNFGATFVIRQIQFISTDIFSVIFGPQEYNHMSNFVRSAAIFGTGTQPHPFALPMIYKPASSMNIQLRNDTANPNVISLTFEGDLQFE